MGSGSPSLRRSFLTVVRPAVVNRSAFSSHTFSSSSSALTTRPPAASSTSSTPNSFRATSSGVAVEAEVFSGGGEADQDRRIDLRGEGGGVEDAHRGEPVAAAPDPRPRPDPVDAQPLGRGGPEHRDRRAGGGGVEVAALRQRGARHGGQAQAGGGDRQRVGVDGGDQRAAVGVDVADPPGGPPRGDTGPLGGTPGGGHPRPAEPPPDKRAWRTTPPTS